mmetsp:Transcript_14470/g.31974  ORF Transcript_14470/g.31974 Transcript_14470/m.31974 type:complete len:452 (+) Transcript_14470:145-1500(+)
MPLQSRAAPGEIWTDRPTTLTRSRSSPAGVTGTSWANSGQSSPTNRPDGLQVENRSLLESHKSALQIHADAVLEEEQALLAEERAMQRARCPMSPGKSGFSHCGSRTPFAPTTPFNVTTATSGMFTSTMSRRLTCPNKVVLAKNQHDQEERKNAELQFRLMKYKKEVEHNRQRIKARVEEKAHNDDKRLQRAMSEILQEAEFAKAIGQKLEDEEERQHHRLRAKHAAWEDAVYGPMAAQVDDYLNPPDRKVFQKAAGFKQVDFTLPEMLEFRIVAPNKQDPNKEELIANEQNRRLSQAADRLFLGRSGRSMLRSMSGSASVRAVNYIPEAKVRSTLDPSVWDQALLVDAPQGFQEACRMGDDFSRGLRRGHGRHLHKDYSGGPPAGTRHSRTGGYNDPGILKGSIGPRGEASLVQDWWGAGSGAPAQDHYHFPRGRESTDLEFPLGKRICQ